MLLGQQELSLPSKRSIGALYTLYVQYTYTYNMFEQASEEFLRWIVQTQCLMVCSACISCYGNIISDCQLASLSVDSHQEGM